MPVYCFMCPYCDHRQEIFVQRMDPPDKPKCEECGGVLARDKRAELGAVQTDWTEPILSDALAVDPSQIAEARARFPHHEFAPDGRMILRSKKARARVLRDLGFVDRSGYD